MRQGLIYVVSAPSGAGKTTLCRRLLGEFPKLTVSVSYTTRAPRDGERDGIDYHFVSVDAFRRMIDESQFAEWARVHGNYYGTALSTLREASRNGSDILLDIDCQGAAQLKKTLDNGVFIFILPPGFDELQRRLEGRNTDAADVVRLRIENARSEVLESRWYDYIVVNDNFDFALQQLKAILLAETCRTNIVLPVVRELFERHDH